MKKKYWVLTTLALFIVAISFATDTPKMNIVPTESEKALVTFESNLAFPVEITICNDNGEIVYYWKGESLHNRLSRVFDSSELGCGNFNVCLNYGGKSINRELCINKNEMKVGPAIQLYEPFFQYENDRLNFSFLNVAQKNVYLNVYQGGEHITGIKLGNNMDIQKCLDFSKLKEGEYEVVVNEHFKDHHFLVQK